MSECTYELKTPFKYSYKGDMQEASFITLFPPTYKQVDKVTPIKQAFSAAIKESMSSIPDADVAAASEASDGDTDISASDVLSILFQWSGNLTKVMQDAASLFKSGGALIEGETAFNKELLEKLSMTDFEGLVGKYIANFIVPSLMDGR